MGDTEFESPKLRRRLDRLYTLPLEEFTPVIGDAESEALAWVAVDDVEGLPLHPGFAASWPALRAQLA